ncbi:ABC transporter permease [Nocardia yunnanensis]|uniref:ABC transporter permease n=1 Tax=Nocardia yunnanensis TaxID=2382165 RepID=A0A386ZAP5_9NOCA|nr:ABC transporter permease [Nocardia yunnanensis]AYF74912.1 ABC transporter permease [Nocardia yunnanensis]
MNNRLLPVLRHRLFWPALALVALLIVDVVHTPGFLSVRMQDGHLYGGPIDILRYGAPLVLISVGMTLVIATGGIDLSVGAVVAIAGALACLRIGKMADQNALGGVLVAIALAIAVGAALGLWNGILVSRFHIQPIVATLILMVAGRGLAQLITQGQIITINSSPYHVIGGGFLATLPVPVLVAVAVTALVALLLRRTALGLLLESVGGNARASRLVGVRAGGLIVGVYVVCAVCAAVAGLMTSSNVSAADSNNAGLWIELDAILAVVLGGTALTGGRFHLGGTVLGALVIQTLTTTIYTIGVPPETTLLFKALVVIAVCLVQSPAFRAKVFRARRGRRRVPATAADEPASIEPTGEAVHR